MCDYCADGLWENGAAINVEILAEDLNLKYEELIDLESDIEDWQNIYEGFDFWSDRADAAKTYETPEFKKFLELGERIAFDVRKIVPDNIDVIYYKEGNPNARYYVHRDGTMTLKEKYD
jgi:quinol monooxygenase YgiN